MKQLDGGYVGIEVAFGGDQKAEVHVKYGTLGKEDDDLRAVMVRDDVQSAARNVVQELGEHAIAEIWQQLEYHRPKGVPQ